MLVPPHGGSLINRVATGEAREIAKEKAKSIKLIRVSIEKLKEIQNIAHGVFSPLKGFLTREEITSVIETNRMLSGEYWTIPILLSVSEQDSRGIEIGETVAIGGHDGRAFAIMEIEDVFTIEKEAIAKSVFGTLDNAHPGVAKLFSSDPVHLGGAITLFDDIPMDYAVFYKTPEQTRQLFEANGWSTVVAFQTRNPPHRAHEYLQKTALEICDGLFINPVIGQKKSGDFTDSVILQSYKTLIDLFYPMDRVLLSILPWEMRYAGPKEAIFHAIVRKNFGCSHHIIGRDHAGVGSYYDSFAAQKIFEEFPGLGIAPLCFENSFYCTMCQNMGTMKTCPHDSSARLNPSGTKIRSIVTEGAKIHSGIMRPEIADILSGANSPFVE